MQRRLREKGIRVEREDLDVASKLIYFSTHSTLKNRSIKITVSKLSETYKVTAWYSNEDGEQHIVDHLTDSLDDDSFPEFDRLIGDF